MVYKNILTNQDELNYSYVIFGGLQEFSLDKVYSILGTSSWLIFSRVGNLFVIYLKHSSVTLEKILKAS